MKREPPGIPHAAVRVDVHMIRYDEGFGARDPAQIDRLAELICNAVTDAIYAHADAELGPGTMMTTLGESVHARVHEGLGPAWSPEEGSDPWIPGSMSAPSHDADFSLECEQFYQHGKRHITVVVDWS
jgi:hypothetical protein